MKGLGKRITVIILAVATAIATLGGCGAAKVSTTEDSGNVHMVTFYNGDTKLGTESVPDGNVIEESVYGKYEELDGYELQGWYGTKKFIESSLVDPKTLEIKEDMNLYGKFKNANLKEDTRTWHLVGQSDKGTLTQTNFGGSEVADDIRAEFALTAATDGTNEFTITEDLFANDEFQLIADWDWTTQRGFGFVANYDEAYFGTGYSTSGETGKSNITVLQDGNYTIKLATDPENESMDAITLIRNGDALTNPEPVEEIEQTSYTSTEQTNVKLKGSWKEDWSDLRVLERIDSTSQFSITMDMDANTQFGAEIFEGDKDAGIFLGTACVKDSDSQKLVATDQENITVKEAGTYTITVDVNSMTITITK